MTRVNVIPANMLLDQHLQAEINEIPRIAPFAKKYWLTKPTKGERTKLPETYRTGEGHMKFFYNKGTFIRLRSLALDKEGFERKVPFRPSYSRLYEDYLAFTGKDAGIEWVDGKWIEGVDDDWLPSKEDIRINGARILERVALRPFFYKWHGVKLTQKTYEEYVALLNNYAK